MMGEVMKEASFSLTEAYFAAGDFRLVTHGFSSPPPPSPWGDLSALKPKFMGEKIYFSQ